VQLEGVEAVLAGLDGAQEVLAGNTRLENLRSQLADASASDRDVTAVREAARLIAEDERLTPVLVPLGDGLLAAARD